MADETIKIQATLPEGSGEWLRETYPDAKSDSERVAMAISDARRFNDLISAESLTAFGDPDREKSAQNSR